MLKYNINKILDNRNVWNYVVQIFNIYTPFGHKFIGAIIVAVSALSS